MRMRRKGRTGHMKMIEHDDGIHQSAKRLLAEMLCPKRFANAHVVTGDDVRHSHESAHGDPPSYRSCLASKSSAYARKDGFATVRTRTQDALAPSGCRLTCRTRSSSATRAWRTACRDRHTPPGPSDRCCRAASPHRRLRSP